MIKLNRIRWSGSVAGMYTDYWWEIQKERYSKGGSRYKLEDDSKMDLKETEWNDIDWIHMAQGRSQ
jgi:hypothetical protein